MKTKLLSLLLFLAMTVGYSQINSVALVGAATPNGWPTGAADEVDPHVMTTTDGVTYTLANFTVTTGGAKFRANNAWAIQWGALAFPAGNGGDSTGGSDIPVIAGTYDITLNVQTGDYAFVGGTPISVVRLVGSAVEAPEGLQMSTANGSIYTYGSANFVAGTLQFNVDGNLLGGIGFPAGVIDESGTPINVPAGTFNVTFDLENGTYAFTPPTVSLVGPGAGGWPGDPGNAGPIDTVQLTSTDNVIYTINNLVLVDGPVKFRANNQWTTSWGGVTFPTGPDPLVSNDDIQAVAGTYNVTFNRLTGEYNFADALATKNFNSSTFRAYPNPTNSSWNFTSAKESIESIQIVNVLGKVVMTAAPKNTVAAIDASGLTTGVYFAKIATAAGTTTVKLVKN